MAFPGKSFSKSNSKNSCSTDAGKLNQMVKDRAYYLWLEKGKPHGQDTSIWFQAEKEVLVKTKK